MKKYNGKNIIVMACSNCNIDCSHCYVSYKGNFDSNNLLDLVKELKKDYNITINGAELLTNINYLKSLQEINQTYLMSNGLAIYNNPQIVDILKKHDIKSVSLSYHYGIQDDLSVMSISKIEEVIRWLRLNNLEVRLLTTITSKNYNQIEQMCLNAYRLNTRGIKFTNFLSQGNAIDMSKDNILSEQQKKIFFEQLYNARMIYDINELIIERCGSFGKDLIGKKNHFKCDAISDTVVLTPDYNIYPCIFLAKPGYEIGRYENGEVLLNVEPNIEFNSCIAEDFCNMQIKSLKIE